MKDVIQMVKISSEKFAMENFKDSRHLISYGKIENLVIINLKSSSETFALENFKANDWIPLAFGTVCQVYEGFGHWGETSGFPQHSVESTGSFFRKNKGDFSSGFRVPLLLFLLLIFIEDFSVGSALTIHVSNQVVVTLPAPLAILRCRVEYASDEKGPPVTIRWDRGAIDGESVFYRTSTGRNITGNRYRNVKLGVGCSLIIPNPNTTLTGEYTVTVDVFEEVSEIVHLFVMNKTSSKIITTTTADEAISEAVEGESYQGGDRVWMTYLTAAVSLGVVTTLIGTVLIGLLYRRQRLSKLVSEGHRFPPDRTQTSMLNGNGNIESSPCLLQERGTETIELPDIDEISDRDRQL